MRRRGTKQPDCFAYLLFFVLIACPFDMACAEKRTDTASGPIDVPGAVSATHLGAKTRLAPISANDRIRPDLRDWNPDYEVLCWELIKSYGFQADSLDLLQRMASCDKRYGAIAHELPVVRYVLRDPFKLERIAHEIADPWLAQPSLGVTDIVRFVDGTSAVLTAFDKSRLPKPSVRPDLPSLRVGNLDSHLDFVKALLNEASQLNKKAFAALTEEDVQYIRNNRSGMLDSYVDDRVYRDNWRKLNAATGRLIDSVSKVDMAALFDQARIAACLVSPQFTASLQRAAEMSGRDLHDAVIAQCDTPQGKILVAGKCPTRYDQMDYAAIYDLGGDDVYANNIAASTWGTIATAIIVDYAGSDAYETHRSFSQGCGDFGVGILVYLNGNDSYVGTRFSQGTAFCGVGLLFDEAGDDVYRGLVFHQGVAHWGIGALVDGNGNDRYESHHTSQAVGMPGGFGLLCDGGTGRDSYYCKGRNPTSYGDAGVFEGWGQGVGVGYRRYRVCGGIGLLCDRGGEDRFEAGNFSQGGGYYYGFGVLYNDGSDHDNYIGSRYAQGFGCHQAAGVFIEVGGNDRYQTRQSSCSPGNSWDEAVALFIDESGNDRYEAKGCCSSCMNGCTIFLERGGEDTYSHKNPAIGSWASNSYSGGTSLSFFVDLGGHQDAYPNASNDAIVPGGEWAIFADLPSSVTGVLEQNAWRTILEDPVNSQTTLYLAILAGHKNKARSLIRKGANIDSEDEDGQTLLLYACSKGHSDPARFLIVEGADVNAKSKKGQTPLGQAVQHRMLKVAGLLLDRGATIQPSMLLDAVRKNDKDMAGLLLKKGADIDVVAGDLTPLHLAVTMDRPQMVRYLMDEGADFSPIHAAAYFGELDRVRGYLIKEFSVDARDSMGLTPLHWAVCGGRAAVIRLLVGKGANIDEQDDRGFAPLHYATMRGQRTTVEYLLANGADVSLRTRSDRLPLDVAVESGVVDVVQLLIEHSANR